MFGWSLPSRPGGEIVRALVGEHGDQRIEQRQVEMLADAALGAMRKRGAYGDAGVHAGDQVGDRDPRLLRAAARPVVALAGDAHQAAHALDHEVVPRPLAPRPGMAEAGDRAIDEAGVDLLQLRVAEAVAIEVAEFEVLQQHVAARGELARDRLPLRVREIQRERFLAAVGAGEIGRFAGVAALRVLEPRRAEGARVVTLFRPLDLDHLGAEVGEVLRRPRTREHTRQVEYADSCERARHGRRVYCILLASFGLTTRLLLTVSTPLTPALTRPAREAMSGIGTNPESCTRPS